MGRWIARTLAAGRAVALALFADGRARGDAGPDRTARGDGFEKIDAYVEGQMERLDIPGVSLAVVEDGRISHLRGFGRARPGGEAVTPRTPFFIGSLTKSFTALAVMQLVEAGRVDLDAPVRRYLPWFRVADRQATARMTVRHLLNQTSGLPTLSGEIQLADPDDHPDATARQARALSTVAPSHPVGSTWEYSNANYSLLGLIIEAASGEPYADYARGHIFVPLEMRRTYTSRAEARRNGLAVGHRYWFGVPFADPDPPLPHGSLPAGLLISTAEDLARYLLAHLDPIRPDGARIISRAGMDELHRGAAEFSAFGSSMRYGMGWFVDRIGRTTLVWHSGTLPDFGAYMALLPDRNKGVVLLFDACHHWFNPVLTGVGMGAVALLADAEPTPVRIVGMIPWVLRAQLLIPMFQLAGVAADLRLIRRWRRGPEHRLDGRHVWGRRILLPLVPHLLVALTLKPLLGQRRGYLRLYTPDYYWIAKVCGGSAVVWSILRTGLVLRMLRKGPRAALRVGPASPGSRMRPRRPWRCFTWASRTQRGRRCS